MLNILKDFINDKNGCNNYIKNEPLNWEQLLNIIIYAYDEDEIDFKEKNELLISLNERFCGMYDFDENLIEEWIEYNY